MSGSGRAKSITPPEIKNELTAGEFDIAMTAATWSPTAKARARLNWGGSAYGGNRSPARGLLGDFDPLTEWYA